MRRPQGYDRSSAEEPGPASSPETPARSDRSEKKSVSERARSVFRTTLATRASSSPEDAPGSPGAPESSGEPQSVATLTEPVPILRPPQEESPYAALPSNREISKALRQVRRERKRVERGEVRRFTHRSRRRRQGWIAAAGALTALVLGVVLVGFSPLLALKHIEVTGTSQLDPQAIVKKLSDQLGKPLPLLDQAALSRDLAAFPLIRSYAVESHPPDRLVIRIVERTPIGVIHEGIAFTLVDEAKVAISSSAARPDGFPLISAAGAPAEKNTKSGFAAAASVLAALPADIRARVDTITAKTKDDVSFTLRESGALVVWGSADDSALKAADLAALLAAAGGSSRFDVSSPRSVTPG